VALGLTADTAQTVPRPRGRLVSESAGICAVFVSSLSLSHTAIPTHTHYLGQPAFLHDFHPMGPQQSSQKNPQKKRPQKRLQQRSELQQSDGSKQSSRPQSFRPRVPNVQFRVLIIGRANAGKTTILQRVCDTTESPEIYRRDPSSGAYYLVCSYSWWHFRSHHPAGPT
jgi:hypothetical protein